MAEQVVQQSGATMAKPRDQPHGSMVQLQVQSQDSMAHGSSIIVKLEEFTVTTIDHQLKRIICL